VFPEIYPKMASVVLLLWSHLVVFAILILDTCVVAVGRYSSTLRSKGSRTLILTLWNQSDMLQKHMHIKKYKFA